MSVATAMEHELVSGKWNPEDFLLVPPGQGVIESFTPGIVKACEACPR